MWPARPLLLGGRYSPTDGRCEWRGRHGREYRSAGRRRRTAVQRPRLHSRRCEPAREFESGWPGTVPRGNRRSSQTRREKARAVLVRADSQVGDSENQHHGGEHSVKCVTHLPRFRIVSTHANSSLASSGTKQRRSGEAALARPPLCAMCPGTQFRLWLYSPPIFFPLRCISRGGLV